MMRRWHSLAGAAAAILGSALLTGVGSGPTRAEEDIALTTWHGGQADDYHFDIKASSVTGLYPGARKRIDLTFVNSYSFPLRVTSIEGRLVETSKRGCRPTTSNLSIGRFGDSLPLTLKSASRTKVGHIEVRMPNTVVDACQRATFTVRVTGRATKATR